ncbi:MULTISPECIES: SusC/RagA family TonB-linked outer membrane protein [unclassified Chryseobacterium]|uniref:SusC/RagA family TonB-linked outer membrane protein n=1 Tax=unclassified Chryseobacterium TaxID=2593645 RepID=UPI00210EF3C1|nr:MULTISPECIES: SusC/RagA family TonB-linked outer membrane protein [unclassified Chryseobacterium]MCQ4141199.1 SusC/RagA family TonB-linked outer membrane protein [Chryseobacterium sp. EO14]MCY1663326.1 SusC/RagA family TonB-linked outer membrane protein [Chryseobacterium sp. SL1]
MKKLTAGILILVLSSSLAVSNAQQKKNDTVRTQEIEGVVVTALGIKREKKSLGYASEEVKADALTGGTTNTGNVASLLSGKVSGLQVNTNNNFGGSANLLIRGYKSLSGGSPLIVIDGSPVNNGTVSGSSFDYGNFLSDINQDDIESINVLKGAAASALYGERGSDGVILIVTKNGRGKQDGSWGVTLNSGITAGFIDRSTFPKYQTRYGAGYGRVYGDGTEYFNHDPNTGELQTPFTEDASYGAEFNPSLMVRQWDSYNPDSPTYGQATPWQAAKNGPIKFFETPVTYVNTISLEKGSKSSNISLSYTNMLSNGLLPNSDLRKNSLSAKFNYDFTDKLHASVFSTLTIQDTKGRNETGYSDNLVSGFRQWWQTNVDIYDLKNAYERSNSNLTWNRTSGSDGTPAYWNNPYFQRYQNYQSDTRTRSFSYAQLKYDINKNIGITGKLSYDQLQMLIEERLMNGSLPQAFGASGNSVTSGYSRQDVRTTETNFDLFLNYKFDITSDLNVSGLVGGNVRRNLIDNVYVSTEGGLATPGLFAISNSASPIIPPDENYEKWLTSGVYATASFGYKNLLYIDGTVRADKSSNLPKNNNSYIYPSVTGSVILSELWKPSFLSFWKIRGNYAEVGSSTKNYQLQNTYRVRGGFGNTGLVDQSYFLANPNLKPQRSKEVEFGMEAQFFKNRLGFDVAIYKTRTFDQIINLPVSSATGYRTFLVNAGQINNKGIEVQLNGSPIKTDNFKWDIDVNWSKNQNEVISLNGDSQNYLLASYQGGVSLNARVGEAFGALVGSDYVYLNGEKVINPSTGRYLTNPNQVIGNITPDWIGGIRNSFNYKGLSLSFLIDVKHGGDVFSTDMYYGLATGLYEETAVGDYRTAGVINPGVNPNGQVNTTPTAAPDTFGNVDGYRRMPNSRFVYDASYVKLREASIGYSLPKSILANTSFQEVKISLVGRNLWIIHKNLPYADPETGTGNGLASKGNSIGVLPTTRDLGINVTLKF